MFEQLFRHALDPQEAERAERRGVPGKVTLTSRLAPRPARPEEPREIAARAFTGPARELPLREEMERCFSTSFADVRVYTDAPAREAAAELGATAFALGDQIAFATDQPDRALIAHELTHVVQARGGASSSSPMSDPSDAAEREAEDVAAVVAAGGVAEVRGAATAELHRSTPASTPAPAAAPGAAAPVEPDAVPIKAKLPANEKLAAKARKAVALMSQAKTDPYERNTAQRIIDGDITVSLLEDLPLQPDQAGWLLRTFPTKSEAERKQMQASGKALVFPCGVPAYIPDSAHGLRDPNDPSRALFVRGSNELELMKTTLIHEASHALNPPEAANPTLSPGAAHAWETFCTEARAYYIGEYRELKGEITPHPFVLPDETTTFALTRLEPSNGDYRLAVAKLMALFAYGLLTTFESDPAFQAAAFAWKPTGNVDNSAPPP